MIKNLLVLVSLFAFLLTSCSVPKWAKPGKSSADRPVNAQERARQNVNEGRGVSLKGLVGGGRKGTNYEFSTSNPMWRSTLEILDFLPLSNVDYSGGMIITDWYSDSNSDDSIKITIRFLSNEIRSDSLKIIVHNKKCQNNQNCKITLSDSRIKEELQRSILAKAMLFEKESKEKK